MTDVVTDRKAQATSHPFSPTTPTGPSPTSLHAMSTRSSDSLARSQSTHQQQPQTSHSGPQSATESPSPPGARGFSPVEGRLTRKRARSIDVEEANYPRVDHLTLQSPALGDAGPSSASTVSNSDLICICPSPPKVPRPRNGTCVFFATCLVCCLSIQVRRLYLSQSVGVSVSIRL